jgi:hypothetical protein
MVNMSVYNKLNENFNFKFIKIFDIKKILKHLESFSEEWSLDTRRQNQVDQTHKYTEAYYINLVVGNWKLGSYFLTQNVSRDNELYELTKPIVEHLEKIHDGVAGVVMYVKLLGKNKVLEHSDNGDYLESVRRHHIPIKTNKDVLFFVNQEEKNILPGECWEINNNRPHMVLNGGEERIHLIVDIMPNTILKGENNV